ncbi:hypothetical protein TrispH2_004348 [Trichoplax sp. H2]|nr:hypothetical protein TrispH2_004348 [Trichoplax sp. H2]|eukprot:RDD44501.1 hypothetical protein TrispH2_004348 [Trichoplax sp. H2]
MIGGGVGVDSSVSQLELTTTHLSRLWPSPARPGSASPTISRWVWDSPTPQVDGQEGKKDKTKCLPIGLLASISLAICPFHQRSFYPQQLYNILLELKSLLSDPSNHRHHQHNNMSNHRWQQQEYSNHQQSSFLPTASLHDHPSGGANMATTPAAAAAATANPTNPSSSNNARSTSKQKQRKKKHEATSQREEMIHLYFLPYPVTHRHHHFNDKLKNMPLIHHHVAPRGDEDKHNLEHKKTLSR